MPNVISVSPSTCHSGVDTHQAMLEPFGPVVSCRILRDYYTQASRGVGFARMQTREVCETILAKFDGTTLDGALPVLTHPPTLRSNRVVVVGDPCNDKPWCFLLPTFSSCHLLPPLSTRCIGRAEATEPLLCKFADSPKHRPPKNLRPGSGLQQPGPWPGQQYGQFGAVSVPLCPCSTFGCCTALLS